MGPAYDQEPVIVEPSVTTVALVFQRTGGPALAAAEADRWAVTGGHPVWDELIRNVRRVGSRLGYDRPVWGQYAAVMVERHVDRVTAWATVPAFDGLYWAQDSEHVYVSNRPLLPALALAGGRRAGVRRDERYLAHYLYSGYSLEEVSPFAGVSRLPVDRSLEIVQGRARLGDVPPGLRSTLTEDHTPEEGAEAAAEAMLGAMDRVEAVLDGRPVQLRLSGGKDSRTLLALLKGRDMEVHAVTFGEEHEPDPLVARMMTGRLGMPLTVTQPTPIDATGERERILTTLFQAGGQPLSEAHTARYVGSNPRTPGEGIMLGQWPLLKGGMAQRLRYTTADALRRVRARSNPDLLVESRRRPLEKALTRWFHEVPAQDRAEKLYLYARQFRSGAYLHAHIAHYGRDATIAYPLGDAEVTAVADALTMGEKVSHRALFGALARIWPEVMAVPLGNNSWGFEQKGPDPTWSGPFYAERTAPLPDREPAPRTGPARIGEYSSRTLVELSRILAESPNQEVLQDHLPEPLLFAVAATALSGSVSLPDGMDRRRYAKNLWRVAVADLWYGWDWMPA
ncbi:hypothetical protein [Micrococcus luteus]|uniref:hypothetical protein n=1 Tax=Micrococcus luteus TaxID=1270 RepID=UPI00147D9AE3|nr:hypothetical protein [Micrococcus luteus]NNM37965.1 hypothetical protein [Micrococcus luteus]